MDDLISRQAAIDAVIKRDANCGIDSAEVLKALPSAQPEITETQVNELAIRILTGDTLGTTEQTKEAVTMAVRALSNVVERKKGKWIVREREALWEEIEAKCSCCGFETLVNEPGNGLHMVSDLHYCPNCGADMRGDGNGN